MVQLCRWILFFFLYSLCGWIWESCFVSARSHKWVNRGFLHGPMLPIYGFGAVFILVVTLPVEGNLILAGLLGAVAATALEYVTGVLMERLFGVRYWDYSHKKFNVNGHICLSSSLCWGVFSVLLVKFIHPAADRLLSYIPAAAAGPAALILLAVFAVDLVFSVQAALQLKQLLIRLTAENEKLQELAQRAELTKEELLLLRQQAEEAWHIRRQSTEADLRRLQDKKKTWEKEREAKLFSRWQESELGVLNGISDALEERLDRLEQSRHADHRLAEAKRAEVLESLNRVQARKDAVSQRTLENCRPSLRILRGNPTARAKKFQPALDSLQKAAKLADSEPGRGGTE